MKKRYLMALLPALALPFTACKVQQTEEGDMPDVKVEGGKLPEYDVDPLKIEMQKDTKQVVVPRVRVTIPRDTIKQQ